MEWWALGVGVVIGFAVATLGAWQARRALWKRQAEEIQDVAQFGWMKLERLPDEDPDDNGNENRS